MNNNLFIIGCGFVGNSVYHGFSPKFNIKIFDKFKEGYHSLEETINHSKYIFICVPIPMMNDGSQDLSNIYEVINDLKKYIKYKIICMI
jgi:predicted ferric reductase